jgi:hypothetical protein
MPTKANQANPSRRCAENQDEQVWYHARSHLFLGPASLLFPGSWSLAMWHIAEIPVGFLQLSEIT